MASPADNFDDANLDDLLEANVGLAGQMTPEALDELLASAGAADVPEPKRRSAAATASAAAAAEVRAATVELPSFDTPAGQAAAQASSVAAQGSMSRVRDVPLDVTVELGRTKLLIRDILDLGVGSIVELDKIAGEPVDLFANGLLIARGEVVVIDDNFGIRITEIITADDRSTAKDQNVLAA